jgi:hypothetical protein
MVHVIENAPDTVAKLLILINERGRSFVPTKPLIGCGSDAVQVVVDLLRGRPVH